MIRILHTADIHLDSPLRSLALRDPQLREEVRTASRLAFTRIIDIALAEDVAALLIAGDLFDGAERSARTAAFLVTQFERLRDCGIRVFYIKGNHDAVNPLTGEASLPDNVHVFGGRGGSVELVGGVWIHGVSFSGRHAPESLLPKFPPPVAGATNIALLHTSLAGAEGHDPYAPCSVSDLASAGFDYWALGHVHRRQVHCEAPWIVMPGTPQGRDIGEGGSKSVTLLHLGEAITIEEIATSAVEFLQLTADAGAAEHDDALRDLLRRTLREAARGLGAGSGVVRLVLEGRTPRHWQILRDRDLWIEAVREFARETGKLWLDKVVFRLSDGASAGQGATDELADIMTAVRAEAGFAHICRSEAEEVLMRELPAQRRAELLPDEAALDALVRRLAGAGALRLLARMKGAAS